MTLGDADDAALDAGANLALIGDELIQFGRAEPLGGVRWRLSILWRGRRGTEAAMGMQAIGDRFVLISADRVTVTTLPVSAIGSTIRILASGVGDVAGPAMSDAGVTGISVLPPSPVHLAGEPQPNGDIVLSWTRRSRAGWGWIDGIDAPLAEEREAYRVVLVGSDGSSRTIDVETPGTILAAADRGNGELSVTVRQIGLYGESSPTSLTLPSLQGASND